MSECSDMEFQFEAALWKSEGPGAWHFVTLPEDIAGSIRFFNGAHLGFGTVSVVAKVGNSHWKTSLFPDKKARSYLLPVKSVIRKAEGLGVGETFKVSIACNF